MQYSEDKEEFLTNSFGSLNMQLSQISQSLNDLRDRVDKSLDTDNVAILWDVENVTPSADSLFIEGFLEYAEQFGRITVAKAFADWTQASVAKLAESLSSN